MTTFIPEPGLNLDWLNVDTEQGMQAEPARGGMTLEAINQLSYGVDDSEFASDRTFAQVNDVHVNCLTWHATGLYACTDQFEDGYNVAVSTDEGQTFNELSQLSSPCGPPEVCAAGSSIGDECTARWPEEQAELGAPETCLEGGTGGGSGDTSSGSCGCRLEAHDEHADRDHAAWLVALLGAAAVAVRRRRR